MEKSKAVSVAWISGCFYGGCGRDVRCQRYLFYGWQPDQFNQGAVLSIVAIGQTFVIITGGIDLSVAPLISLSTVVAASLITDHGLGWGWAVMLAVLVCMACGYFNGVLITFVNIPPIIATLATTMAYQGMCLLYTKGYGINLPSGNGLTAFLGRGKFLGIPVAGYVMVIVYLFFYMVLKYTKLGRVTYGLGGNSEAVRLSGISITKSPDLPESF